MRRLVLLFRRPQVPPMFAAAVAAEGGWWRSVRKGYARVYWTRRGWLLVPTSSGAAPRTLFWVGGTAVWNSTAGTKWSLTSGGAGGQAIPTASDDVFFNASSGAVTVTLNNTSVARSIDCTGFTGSFTHNAAVTVNVGDPAGTAPASNIALKMVAGMSYNLGDGATSAFAYVGTNATAQKWTTAGKSMGNFTVNAVGGTVQFQDSFTGTTTQTVTLTAGTLDTNGQTCAWGTFASSNTNTRTLTLGSSAITLRKAGITTLWNCATSTNMTITANTATITITANDADKTFAGGSLAYNSLVLTAAGTNSLTITGGPTFATLTVAATTNSRSLLISTGTTVTVTATLSLTGTGGGTLTVDNDTPTPSSTTIIDARSCSSVTQSNDVIVTADVQLLLPGVTLAPTGIASGETFGVAHVLRVLAATGIASGQTVGAHTLRRLLAATGISSTETFGSTKLIRVVSATAIAPGGVGTPAAVRLIFPSSIAPADAFGLATVQAIAPPFAPIDTHVVVSDRVLDTVTVGDALLMSVLVSDALVESVIVSEG